MWIVCSEFGGFVMANVHVPMKAVAREEGTVEPCAPATAATQTSSTTTDATRRCIFISTSSTISHFGFVKPIIAFFNSGTLQVVRCLGFSGLVPQSFTDFGPPSHC